MSDALVPSLGALFPMAISMALVVAGGRVIEGRRRRTLNECLHELRRPLQALALAAKPAGQDGLDPLELALAALRDLDRKVNGGSVDFRRRPVEARMLAIAACERWRARAARAGRRIAVRWRCGDALADVDPLRVSQALDNLIANALEHGGGRITLEGVRHGDRIDLVVRDSGGVRTGRIREHADPRRGHGLRVTRRLARQNGGELRIRGGGQSETVASLVLPLVPERPEPLGSPHRR
ncbi:MAG: two-component system, OmpR family, sensor histidine kinase BaeS [Solirubrobacterales bacterium]|jgi:signal transduction histidine kinase|nr:two-component system, OmpR family, sensor histidine kinase BaeS [Solirubrobacterales bacterium]